MQTFKNNDDGSSSQGRKKVWSSFRGNFGKRDPHYEHGGYEPQPSHLQEDDETVSMGNVQEDPQVRHTPYSTRCNKRRVKRHNEGHIHITVWKGRKTLKKEVGENTQDGTSGSWFKITIPYGRKYDKAWLMNSIQSHCSVPFIPVDFHYVKNQARFFVQDVGTASALKDISYRICDDENRKISIFVNPSTVPYSVRYKLEPEEMEQLKLTMNKRYDVSQQALDLQSLRFDPDLVGHDIDIILNRRNCMAATLQIIEENFPELLSLNLSNNKLYGLDGLSDIIEMAPTIKVLNLSKNEFPPHISQLNLVWELSKMKGLKLEELWLEGNPLCDTFPDQPTYISAIRDCFPKLLRLHPGPPLWSPLLTSSLLQDGQELPPPVIIDADTPCLIKPCKESYKGSETLKSLVLQFLQQYYLIYDSGDRQGLLGAYHDEACFSLAISFNPEDPAPSSLCEYSKESRNMKKLKDLSQCVQLLKHTNCDIVCSLCVLPKTQHDLSSLVVDMWFQTEKMLCFSVNGVFKEVEGKFQGSVRAFTRTFIVTPASNSSLCIVNDELFVRDATPGETQSAFSNQETFSSMPTLSQEQQEMVHAFSTQSGMKLEWSQKCLQDNEWNYTRAGQVFTVLQKESKIPEEAFKQIT
ncbi:nuclear RNA export factor 2-like isoform X24 [Canis lupus familiaris]|uniref:nuclear RNA export factor 2-like isoform X6 n=2 Tax=Canis lupus TaxID=9612 RepID=UPI0003AE5550|nr:nuclear RNA export factor 2-like isoform X6 [Canis lupus dingo]XP_025287557.1 nuclear RNA export factor 2-like isoform X6 [Canis lupus dingo]XP_038443850.1 nuclear RNA export factor 2-like isoform X24 [Canis lupus familiaris]|eukprot:XP_005641649.1 nuclear RNA export factor 2 isoform X6 [Canis lupus familiaris]